MTVSGNSNIYLLVYVDNMLIAANSMTGINDLKKLLSKEFDMKYLGEANKILGMEIHRKNGEVHLLQKKYIEKVVQRYGMNKCKPVTLSLTQHFRLFSLMAPQSKEKVEYMSKVPYCSAVGSIMYVMVCTGPDITQAVSVVSRFMSKPDKKYWEAIKWILKYLKGSSNVGLTFYRMRNEGFSVLGYVDSDFAGDLDRKRSTTGYIFTLKSSAISWKATLQSIVALSTIEAEYMAAGEAIKEAIWLNGLVSELSRFQH
ncbi:secreted RxLR effector protein 161-like [Lycium barbarum]|uniref:secreted RxLR effector protein 161-like n=1 Tax=Lycium barbarum TaxID=112863 RepID=UPI00293EF9C1|nr:secreted RxLR effector protein 161-like [Lycium barbarum]